VGLLGSQRGIGAFEVVIVDDSSTDDTARVLSELVASADFSLRSATTPRPSGAAAARNVGWRLAAAPHVAFTDDDCRPDPDWLASLTAGLAHADVVQGITTCDTSEEQGRGPFSQVVHVLRWSGQFETSNVAYRHSTLSALEGFDERFKGDSYGEDVDLGWRAVESGARVAFASNAVVVHDVKRGRPIDEFIASIRGVRRWHRIGQVVRDHPAYRPYRMYRSPFLAPTHPPMLLALGGLSALVIVGNRRAARLVALAALLPWLRHRTVVDRRPGRLRHLPITLPAAFIVDAVEVITVARSGVRYRAYVL
jgi:glycosyltransferase involved in cell wall biosynthesis